MNLNILWFLLIAVLYAGFFFLEGFDFGVGMLIPVLGRSDEERRAVRNAIGPHWDGNEVWLVTAGGATFAAFPVWYAALFSGMYPVLFLLLFALIIRGVSFEFRGHLPGLHWRAAWDWAAALASLAAPILLGTVFAGLLRGLPVNGEMNYAGSLWAPFNLYAAFTGLALASIFLLHGAGFLTLKLEGELRERARRIAAGMLPIAAVLGLVFFFLTAWQTDAFGRLGAGGIVLAAAVLLAVLLAGSLQMRGRNGWGFVLGSAAVLLLVGFFFAGLYPRVLVSTIDPAFSLTIYTASSSPYTLRVMSVVAAIFVPLVILYQAWSYWVFRRRLGPAESEMGY